MVNTESKKTNRCTYDGRGDISYLKEKSRVFGVLKFHFFEGHIIL